MAVVNDLTQDAAGGATAGEPAPWKGFFDPDSKRLYAWDSDVDWWRGTYMHDLEKPVRVAARDGNGWMLPYTRIAERMVRDQPDTTAAIMGALFSWRTATIGQLQAGLCDLPVPAFDRGEPNLWGALNRLGMVNIGFSRRERVEGTILPHVWVSVGDNAQLVRKGMEPLADGRPWIRHVMASGMFRNMHAHARHNTFAAHTGLAFCHDPRIRLTGGDGWGAFRLIDPQAAKESGAHPAAGMDVVTLTQGNLLAGIEVQASAGAEFAGKFQRWARFLAFSPMSRRGIVCIWLFVKSRSSDGYADYMSPMRRFATLPEMAAGDPDVATRMGWATWDEWYEHGRPTPLFGTWTDMRGQRRSMFDESWRRYTPGHVNGVQATRDWGWRRMRDELLRVYGWDTAGWTFPDDMRGGFHGFAPYRGDGKEDAR